MTKSAMIERAAMAHHHRHCRSCGTPTVLRTSKRTGLCRGCRQHCVACGSSANEVNDNGFCESCDLLVRETYHYMMKHKGKPPTTNKATRGKPTHAVCVECGAGAETVS